MEESRESSSSGTKKPSKGSKGSSKHRKGLRPHSKSKATKTPPPQSGNTPLTTQLPTPATTLEQKMPSPILSTPAEPKREGNIDQETSSGGDIISPFEAQGITMPSMKPTPDPMVSDQKPSAKLFASASQPQKQRIVQPCQNFGNFITWVQENFPDHIGQSDLYFMKYTLKIKSFPQVITFVSMSPQEWLEFLGAHKYRDLLPNIVTLVMILSYASTQQPFPYDSYKNNRDDFYDVMKDDFEKYIIIEEEQPPPYIKVSPIVQHERSVRSQKSKSKTVASKKQPQKDAQKYHPTPPRDVNSQGIPMMVGGAGNPEDPGEISSSSSEN